MSADLHLHAFKDDKQLAAFRLYEEITSTCSPEMSPLHAEFEPHPAITYIKHPLEMFYDVWIEEIKVPDGETFRHVNATFDSWDRIMRRAGLVDGHDCWVGQVSWLKAGLMGDAERYIPDAVRNVAVLVEDTPVIDDALITQIMVAMNVPDRSIYSGKHHRGVEKRRVVKRWLTEHKGLRVGSVSW
jgi:hypothetical protein